MECSRCQRTRKQLDAAEERERDFREKLSSARSDQANLARQLEVTRRVLARVGDEKARLEAASEQDRAAIRTLQQRLDTDTHSKLAKCKSQTIDLREQVYELESRLLLAEERNMAQTREIHVLKGALGLKTSAPDVVLDSQAKLLHALAKSNEEVARLSGTLSDKELMLDDVARELNECRAEIQRLHEDRMQLKSQLEVVQSDAQSEQRTADAARDEARRLHRELDEARALAGHHELVARESEAALAAQQEQGRQLADRLQGIERASRLSVEALRTEVGLAVERSEARSAEARAAAAAAAASQQEELAGLQQQLAEAHQQLEEALDNSQQQATDHEAMVGDLEAQLRKAGGEVDTARMDQQQCRLELQQLRQQHEALSSSYSALQERSRQAAEQQAGIVDGLKAELQRALEETQVKALEEGVAAAARDRQAALDAQEAAAAGWAAKVESLEQRLRAAKGSLDQQEQLKTQVSTLQSELEAASLVEQKLRTELQAARAQANQASAKVSTADSHLQGMRDTIDQLTSSKVKLQTELLDQLASIKRKLAKVEDHNQQLRSSAAAAAHQDTYRNLSHSITLAPPSSRPVSAPRAPSPLAIVRPPSAGLGSAAVAGSSMRDRAQALYDRARMASRALGYEDESESDGESASHFLREARPALSSVATRLAGRR
ncbi:hypothetical protein V8C86DRAFT_1123510 [Haematococcus lacustris]